MHIRNTRVALPSAIAVVMIIVGVSGFTGFNTNATKPASSSQPTATVTQAILDVSASGITVDPTSLLQQRRLIFSTVGNRSRDPQSVRINNQTDQTLHFSDARTDSTSFTVTTNPSFDIAANDSGMISVAFEPRTTGTTNGQLLLQTSDHRINTTVALSGLNSPNFENQYEPNLQTVFDVLGYKVDAGVPASPPTNLGISGPDTANSISNSPRPVGDEQLIHGLTRADASAPVTMIPLASYISRSANNIGPFGINQQGNGQATQRILGFKGGSDAFGGQNQQLLPGIGDGTYSALERPSIAFTPQYSTFGIWDGYRSNFSEDALNNKGVHAMRIYPAVTDDGPISNAYLVADDAGTPTFANYDYQDVVFLITNVRPA